MDPLLRFVIVVVGFIAIAVSWHEAIRVALQVDGLSKLKRVAFKLQLALLSLAPLVYLLLQPEAGRTAYVAVGCIAGALVLVDVIIAVVIAWKAD